MTRFSGEPVGAADDDGDALRDDLERTRERVSADVEALGAKLSAEILKAEAKQSAFSRVQRGAARVR